MDDLVGLEWSWRERTFEGRPILAAVLDQGHVQDHCVQYSMTVTMEARYRIFHSKHDHTYFAHELSPLDVVARYPSGCLYVPDVLDYAVHEGLRTKTAVERNEDSPRFKVERWYEIQVVDDGYITEHFDAIYDHGPVVGTFPIRSDWDDVVGDDVYMASGEPQFKNGAELWHSVSLTGFGFQRMDMTVDPEEPIESYFVFQNSHGKEFGTDGFGRVLAPKVLNLYIPFIPRCPVIATIDSAGTSAFGNGVERSIKPTDVKE